MSELIYALSDGVVTLGLNRPDKANALNDQLVEQLHAGFDAAVREGAHTLVLRGEGRNFCAGFDFSGFESLPVSALGWRFVRIEQFLQKLYHAPFATVALAQGGCYGAGADIVAACGCAIATPESKFRMPGWKFGLALGTRRLAARVGNAAARHLLMEAAVISGAQALALRLVDEVCEAGQFEARVAAQAGSGAGLERAARERLLDILRTDTRAEDMASLVGSITDGDIKARIAAFRNAR